MALQEELLKKVNKIYAKILNPMPISGSVDVTDRAARLLGVMYGSQAQQLLQRALTYDLVVQLRSAGVEIDPRSIRPLTSADVVSVNNLPTSPFDVSDRSGRLLGVVYGSVGQQLLQRASTYELLATLRQAGSELSTSNPIFAGIVDASGNRLPSMDASARAAFVKGREDLSNVGGTFSPSATGVTVVPGVGGKYVKVYAAGYELLAAGLHYLYFGTNSTPPSLPSAKAFMPASAVGRIRQLYSNPMNTGSSGDSLFIYSGVAESNMPLDVQYAQE